jgi:hypothetical protein
VGDLAHHRRAVRVYACGEGLEVAHDARVEQLQIAERGR